MQHAYMSFVQRPIATTTTADPDVCLECWMPWDRHPHQCVPGEERSSASVSAAAAAAGGGGPGLAVFTASRDASASAGTVVHAPMAMRARVVTYAGDDKYEYKHDDDCDDDDCDDDDCDDDDDDYVLTVNPRLRAFADGLRAEVDRYFLERQYECGVCVFCDQRQDAHDGRCTDGDCILTAMFLAAERNGLPSLD